MDLIPLTAISAIDGRYRNQVQHLKEYFSEYALIKYRVFVEIEYLLFLTSKKFFKLSAEALKKLKSLKEDFLPSHAEAIKALERTTNHDVKAVEYFLKAQLEECGEVAAKEWVHFGLTSQDVNNTAIPLLWKHALEHEYLPSVLNKCTVEAVGPGVEVCADACPYPRPASITHFIRKGTYGICRAY